MEQDKYLVVATVYNPTVDFTTQMQSEEDSINAAIARADAIKDKDPANVIVRVFHVHTKEIHSLT